MACNLASEKKVILMVTDYVILPGRQNALSAVLLNAIADYRPRLDLQKMIFKAARDGGSFF